MVPALQLPVPIVVLVLMHREGTLSCCQARGPPLLERERIGMKTCDPGRDEEGPKSLHAQGKDELPLRHDGLGLLRAEMLWVNGRH